ncbi:hypothetical protein CHH53_08580 [Terribacillus sp. 7520-G]|nr:hypothetical protein CHH53_08580 [Terribacillus sp. 7520-G]
MIGSKRPFQDMQTEFYACKKAVHIIIWMWIKNPQNSGDGTTFSVAHISVDNCIYKPVNRCPQFIHNLWIMDFPNRFIQSLKHRYDNRIILVLQCLIDTYPQMPAIVDKKYPQHAIMCVSCRKLVWKKLCTGLLD